jgi:hypothetical protein
MLLQIAAEPVAAALAGHKPNHVYIVPDTLLLDAAATAALPVCWHTAAPAAALAAAPIPLCTVSSGMLHPSAVMQGYTRD